MSVGARFVLSLLSVQSVHSLLCAPCDRDLRVPGQRGDRRAAC